MAKIVVVTSGKGGVGKTTTSASFATGLAVRGFKTVVIDFDVGLRNLDLIMGCENRIVYDFVDVISGNARLSQALVKDKQLNNLFILPASQTRDKDALTDEGVAEVINELAKQFDYIVCDSPAGIERGAQLAMYHADEAIIVTNPEISSVRDSDRIIGILQSRTKKVEEGTWFRPWSYVKPQTLRFIAADSGNARANADNPDIYLVNLYLFERRRSVQQVPQVIDCAAPARADYALQEKDSKLSIDEHVKQTTAWRPLEKNDPLFINVCINKK